MADEGPWLVFSRLVAGLPKWVVALIFVFVVAAASGMVHLAAQPCTRVDVLFGLAGYDKRCSEDASTSEASSPTADGCALMGIEFLEPLDTVSVNQSFSVRGTASTPPEDHTVWLFLSFGRSFVDGYYPHDTARWSGNEWIVTEPGSRRGEESTKQYSIVAVGPEGRRLISEYREDMSSIDSLWARSGIEADLFEWVPLRGRTVDMSRCQAPFPIRDPAAVSR